MRDTLETIRTFNTKHFRVEVTAEQECDVDLSWDDDGEARRGLESGDAVVFCARARVILKSNGAELASDYLGNCIYHSFAEFEDHRGCAVRQREIRAEYEARGERSDNVFVGSYFSDMVRNVCRDARKALVDLKAEVCPMRVRI